MQQYTIDWSMWFSATGTVAVIVALLWWRSIKR